MFEAKQDDLYRASGYRILTNATVFIYSKSDTSNANYWAGCRDKVDNFNPTSK